MNKDTRTRPYKVKRAHFNGDTYCMTWTDDIGVIHTEDLPGAKTRAEAKQMAELVWFKVKPQHSDGGARTKTERKERLVQLTEAVNGRRYTVNDAITKWENEQEQTQALAPLFIAKRVQSLRKWAREMNVGSRFPCELETKHVAQWVNGMMADRKVYTRRVSMSHLSNFFDWCRNAGLTFTNPARQIGRVSTRGLTHELREKRARRIYTDDEIKRFTKAADDLIALEIRKAMMNPLYASPVVSARDAVMRDVRIVRFVKYAFLIGVKLGLRVGDIAGLHHAQFSTPGYLTVWTHKRDKRVNLPLDNEMMHLFSEIESDSHDDVWLFPEAHAEHEKCLTSVNPSPHWRIRPFHRICKAAGISGKNFHDTRSTAIHRWKLEGKTMPHIAELAGHSDTKTSAGYIEGVE